MTTVLNSLTIFLTVSSVAFFTVACIGYADDPTSLKNTSWIVMHDHGHAYFGLRKAYLDSSELSDSGVISYWTNKDCIEDWCDTCNREGESAFSLTIVALFLSFLVCGNTGFLFIDPSFWTQIVNAVMSGIAALFSLIAIGQFMGHCYYEIDLPHLRWGTGSILAVLAMLLMWFVMFIQIAAAMMTGKNGEHEEVEAAVTDL
jgi:uncharacterized membrane protein YGL010W